MNKRVFFIIMHGALLGALAAVFLQALIMGVLWDWPIGLFALNITAFALNGFFLAIRVCCEH